MVQQGRPIKISIGSSHTRPTQARQALTPAACWLANIQQHEEQWNCQRTDEIAALPRLWQNPPPPPPVEGFQFDQGEQDDYLIDMLPRGGTLENDERHIQPANFLSYQSHPTTQQKCI